MNDEELVAREIAELAHYRGSEHAIAERRLLKMLPVADAAAVLREETLDALAETKRGTWHRYLLLEAAELRRRAGGDPPDWLHAPLAQHAHRTALRHELFGGGLEPEQLRYARRSTVSGGFYNG